MKAMNKILEKFSNNRRLYKQVFETPQGQDVLKDLAKFCHMQSPSYTPGDPHGTAYKEGMRRVFLRISNYLNMDEVEIQKMFKENSEL